MRRIIRPLLMLIVLAVIAFGAIQIVSRRPAAQVTAPPRPRPVPAVRTLVVEPTLLVEQGTFPGDVRASATSDVISRIAGRLGAVLVREGSFIGAGGLVARIDDPEMDLAVQQAEAALDVQRARLALLRAGPRAPEVAQVEAQIAQQESALAQAERELARTQQLFNDGLVARASVDRAQTEVELARARVNASREQMAIVRQGPRTEDVDAQIAQVRQAEVALATARARLRERRITSPIAGVVTQVNVESGAVISSQTVLATVATIRPIEAHVPLPETDLPRLRRTSTARITADALPGRVFEGTVARIAPALDAGSRSARVVVVLANQDLALRPGMFARATIIFDERQAVVIPSDSVIRRGNTVAVFVVKDDTVEEREVRLGYVDGSRTEVVEGLSAGEAIVVAGQLGLTNGMRVRVEAGAPGQGRPAGPPRTPGQEAPRP